MKIEYAPILRWQSLPSMLREDILDLLFLPSYIGEATTIRLQTSASPEFSMMVTELKAFTLNLTGKDYTYVIIKDGDDHG